MRTVSANTKGQTNKNKRIKNPENLPAIKLFNSVSWVWPGQG